MKTTTIYQCEYCQSKYYSHKDAMQCEAKCLGLTEAEYKEYIDILWREKTAAVIVSRNKNEKTEKLWDDCIRDVIEFQRKHNLPMEVW